MSRVWMGVRGAVALLFVALAGSCGGSDQRDGPTPMPTPPLTLTVNLSPANVAAGGSAQGTVTVTPTQSQSLVVTLASSNAGVNVPGTVTIPANSSQATFTANAAASATGNATISVSSSGASSQTTLTIAAARVTEADVPICGPWSGPVPLPFHVYGDDGDGLNHFIGSGFFGDTADLRLTLNDRTSPRVGATAMRIDYTPRGSQRFAGIYFQCPANNFGTVAGAGFNLTGARRLTFWARANTPGQAEFKVGGIGRGTPPAAVPDSFGPVSTSPVIVSLGTDWRQFTIDLAGQDLGRTIGGFLFVTNATSQNPGGIVVFLDEIVFE
jgi:hypothetical protein